MVKARPIETPYSEAFSSETPVWAASVRRLPYNPCNIYNQQLRDADLRSSVKASTLTRWWEQLGSNLRAAESILLHTSYLFQSV